MRIGELHTLPRHAVKQIHDANLAAMRMARPFTQVWLMAENVVTICSSILRSPQEVNEIGEGES